jgi:hypothetical protein
VSKLTIATSSFLIYFLATSNEIGSINIIFSDDSHVLVIAISMIFFVLLNFRKISQLRLKENAKINFAAIIFIIASLFSSAYNGGFISPLKYAIYMIFFLILFNFVSRHSLKLYSNFYVNVTSIIATLGILQSALISFDGWNQLALYNFKVQYKNGSTFWGGPDYVAPYGLGLVRVEEPVDFLFLNHVRLIGFSSEPKYYSLVIIIALGFLLYNNKSLKIISILKLFVLLGALALSLAFTSFLILAVSSALTVLDRIMHRSANVKLALILILPFALPFLAYVDLVAFLGVGFAAERWDSFSYTADGVYDFNILNSPFFGFGEAVVQGFGSTFSLYLNQMGLIWGGAMIFLMLTLLGTCFQKFKNISFSQTFGAMLIISTIQIYNFIFLSQAVTLLMVFAFVILLNRTRILNDVSDRNFVKAV